MLNLYRRHMSNLTTVARPLTALTQKDKSTGGTVQFSWTSECEEALRECTSPATRLFKAFLCVD